MITQGSSLPKTVQKNHKLEQTLEHLRPLVGVGVLLMNQDGLALFGLQKGSHGAGKPHGLELHHLPFSLRLDQV